MPSAPAARVWPASLAAAGHPRRIFIGWWVQVDAAGHGEIYGDLTIRGVTREVVRDTEYSGQARSPWGTASAGCNGAGARSRSRRAAASRTRSSACASMVISRSWAIGISATAYSLHG